MKDEIAFKIIHLSKELVSRTKNSFKDKGYEITFEEWMVIVHVGMLGKVPQNKLKDYIGKDRHFTSRLAASLERKGLMMRKPDSIDPRLKIMILTDVGCETFKKLLSIQNTVFEESLSSLDDNELGLLNKIINKLLKV